MPDQTTSALAMSLQTTLNPPKSDVISYLRQRNE